MNATHHWPQPWPFLPLDPLQQRRNAEALAFIRAQAARQHQERVTAALQSLRGQA